MATFEEFRCKEPLSIEIISQFETFIPSIAQDDAKNKIYSFTKNLSIWIKQNYDELINNFGPYRLPPQPNKINRNQPHLIESIFATLIRYEFLVSFLPFLKHFDIGCILGGSMSYSKFFNVRQPLKELESDDSPSDIDLLLVYDVSKFKIDNWTNYLNKMLINDVISPYLYKSLSTFIRLMQLAKVEINNGNNKTTSIKLNIEDSFVISDIFRMKQKIFCFPLRMCIVSNSNFQIMTNPKVYQNCKENNFVNSPEATDIRLGFTPPKIVIHCTMDGIIVPKSISAPRRKKIKSEFHKGKIDFYSYELPMYFYWEKRFVSGYYLNYLLPAFDIIFDNKKKDLERGKECLINFLRQQCRYEQNAFKDRIIMPSNLSPRKIYGLRPIANSLDRSILCNTKKDNKIIKKFYEINNNLKKRINSEVINRNRISINEEIIKFINFKNDLDILDLGCGSGDFLHALKEYGHRGNRTGIDNIPNLKGMHQSGIANFIEGNIQNMNELLSHNGYSAPCFDVIVVKNILYHLSEKTSTIDLLAGWLRDGGKLIASTNSNNNLGFIQKLLSQALLNSEIAIFTKNQYNKIRSENCELILHDYFTSICKVIIENDIKIENADNIFDYIIENYSDFEISLNKKVIEKFEINLKKLLANKLNDSKTIFDKEIIEIIVGQNPIRYT